MSADTPTIRALLVDPSLFTGPYDSALTDGLLAASVLPTWAVRPTRAGDHQEIREEYVDPFFYRRVDQLGALPGSARAVLKGIAHVRGLAQLVRAAYAREPNVVHFQWLVLPVFDALAIWLIRRRFAVLVTLHDTVHFNGDRPSLLQGLGLDLPIRFADGVIVHTQGGKETLVRRGVPPSKVTVIPHGPLELRELDVTRLQRAEGDARPWTFLLFGEIKHYKGVDLLVEAVGLLAPETRKGCRFVVAGRPRMDLAAIFRRIEELGLSDCIEVQARRLTEEEMADLFAETDCFLFPYRQVDASGVYFLTKSLGKWIIASRVGVFAEEVRDGLQGELIPPDDPQALASALDRSFCSRSRPPPAALAPSDSWEAIGWATRRLYQCVMEARQCR